MRLSEIQGSCIVIDAETAATLGKRKTNRIAVVKGGLMQIGIVTLSPVKSVYQETFDGSWDSDGLSDVQVRRRDKALAAIMADMVDKCTKNGINPTDPLVVPKISLAALALLRGGTMISVDDRDTPASMKRICACFGIRFHSLDSIEP